MFLIIVLFVFLFWWLNTHFNTVLASACDHKCPLRHMALKTDVMLVQTLLLIILDVFYLEIFLGWSALVSRCNKVTMKALYGGSDTYKKQLQNLFRIVYIKMHSLELICLWYDRMSNSFSILFTLFIGYWIYIIGMIFFVCILSMCKLRRITHKLSKARTALC